MLFHAVQWNNVLQVKIALMGILAGGCGLNLTAAQDVVILELPKETANFEQVCLEQIICCIPIFNVC